MQNWRRLVAILILMGGFALHGEPSALFFEETQGKVAFSPEGWRLGPDTSVSTHHALFAPTRLDPSVAPRFGNDYWDDDWMGTFRQSFRLEHLPCSWLRLSAKAVLSMNAYRRGGYTNEWGPRASRLFKGNFTLGAEILTLGDRVSFYLPIQFQVSRHANYLEGARFNRRVRSHVWLTPEVSYYAGGGVTFSASYETDTFVASDFSETYFWESLAAGSVYAWISVPL